MMQCSLCGTDFSFRDEQYYELYEASSDITNFLCSPSCLVEVAWRTKENQPKLSKSKIQSEIKNDDDLVGT